MVYIRIMDQEGIIHKASLETFKRGFRLWKSLRTQKGGKGDWYSENKRYVD